MTLSEVQAKLVELADVPGLWVNSTLALAGNVTIDGTEVVVTGVNGKTARLAPANINALNRANGDECGEAGRALWGNFD